LNWRNWQNKLSKKIIAAQSKKGERRGRTVGVNTEPSTLDDEMGLCPSSDKEAKKAHGADSPAPEKLPKEGKDQTNKWKDEKAHAGKFLQGFVGGSGSGQEFDTFSEALDELFCETGHIKGGITQGPNGKYTIRAGTDLRDAPKPEVEVSWLKVDLGNAGTKLETQHVLVGAPPVGPLPQTFRTFSEAVDFLFADSTAKLCAGAGGITPSSPTASTRSARAQTCKPRTGRCHGSRTTSATLKTTSPRPTVRGMSRIAALGWLIR
jgi:hypothetical protein